MAGKIKRTVKTKGARVPSGYVVEEFDLVSSGYGNLMDERFTAAQAIKHFCCECQGGHYFDWRDGDGTVLKKTMPYDAVDACPSTTCYLFPYRSGHRPPARQKKKAVPAGA